MTSGLEDPLFVSVDQSYVKKSSYNSPNQGYSTPFLNKTEDVINNSEEISS